VIQFPICFTNFEFQTLFFFLCTFFVSSSFPSSFYVCRVVWCRFDGDDMALSMKVLLSFSVNYDDDGDDG